MKPYKDKDIRKFIESIPQEEIMKRNKLQLENTWKVYQEFIKALNENKCFLCGSQMDSFNAARPCFHWFTYPKGIKKKYFKKYLKAPLSFFHLESYFRWLANSENPYRNINDLKSETSANAYLETTIKYRNIEWAFSIGHTDKEGHLSSQTSNIPHYHLQMKVNNRVFIKFNDFHIRFTDEDLFTFELLEQAGDKIIFAHLFGEGAGIIEEEKNLEWIDSLMTITDNEETALFERQTMIEAPEGKTIPGELVQKAMRESKETGEPMDRILQKYLSDAKFLTIISPGKGVPEKKRRKKPK